MKERHSKTRGLRHSVAALAAATLMMFAVPAADAATRFAAPNGDGPEARCPQADPCGIQNAVEGPSVVAGDEVVVRNGTYNLAEARLDIVRPINVHGRPGQQPRLISSNDFATVSAIFADGARIAGLEIENFDTTHAAIGLSVSSAAVVDRVVASARSTIGACDLGRGVELRNSVCRNVARSGDGVYIMDDGGGSAPVFTLRNVTAIAQGAAPGIGASSNGIEARTSIDRPLVVDAFNVIASGSGAGVGSAGSDVNLAEVGGSGASIAVHFSHSNYESVTFAGTTSASSPGSAENQTAQPRFVNAAGGNFHQAPGSPTIDAGGRAGARGVADVDGQARIQGGAVDIGADERIAARCAGRRATIVGTKRRDVLRGTRRKDVIVGLGGKDVVKGKGKTDRICGGEGGDVLRGNGGGDTLKGGKGRDRLSGGSGRDRCVGGPGRDRASGCERRGSI